MGKKNCITCNGSGNVMNGVDGHGLPIWNTCPTCGGMGGVQLPSGFSSSSSGSGGGRGRGDPVDKFSELLGLVVAGGVGYLGVVVLNKDLVASGLVALVVGIIAGKVFAGPLREFTEGILTLVQALALIALVVILLAAFFG